jgi:hypothetical protein
MHLKGYDAWKTRNGLDEVLRRLADTRERCFMCDAPLPEAPWSFWTSEGGGQSASLCGDCAPEGEPDER